MKLGLKQSLERDDSGDDLTEMDAVHNSIVGGGASRFRCSGR